MLTLFAFRAYASSNQLYGKVWYVTDEGEKIESPGVVVTLVHDKYGCFQALSSMYGNYRFPNLPSGIYKIKAEVEGSRHICIQGYSPDHQVSVKLCCGKKIRLNVMWTIAGIVDYIGGDVLIQNAIDMSPGVRFCYSSSDSPIWPSQ